MKGFVVAIFSVLAILLGMLCALKLSQAFASWMLAHGYITSGWAQVVSYILLFVVVVVLVRLIARLIEKALEGMMLGLINRLAGGILYTFVGVVLWSSLVWIGKHMNIVTPEAIAASKTYPWFSGIAPWFFEQAGKLIPFARDTFAQLEHFFNSVDQKTPADVGAHR
jgi:membrane protein required for colicin V production